MPEWLIEDGIGETRAILVDGTRVLDARVQWPETAMSPGAGAVRDVRLLERARGSSRGLVRCSQGMEATIDGLPRDITTGMHFHAVITREAVSERGRHKRAQARFTQQPAQAAPTLAQRLGTGDVAVRTVRRFPEDPWPDIWTQALSGEIAFAQGAIVVTPTPAMTLIDVDGHLPAAALALAAVPAIADAIGHFDLAGSIGIDFPTIEAKADKRALDDALAAALDHWPHQRTAINGFGFVQLVARLERPSLLHRARYMAADAAARALLRQAEYIAAPGVLVLRAHPAVHAASEAQWDAELARRTGRRIRREADAGLALHAGFAQALEA